MRESRMKILQFQVDAFTDRLFAGNPAAVCPLDSWLDDELLQAIAEENNLSETAYFVPCERGFELRWFTPTTEVKLCGHATLATAHVLFRHLGYDQPEILFETLSGDLRVSREGSLLTLDFPARPVEAVAAPEALLRGLGVEPVEVWAGDDYMAVLDSEARVRELSPDLAQLVRLDRRAVMVTAPGDHCDFVSRFFAPKQGIPEDPVTGSAHCTLTPYWAQKLGKTTLSARQLSRRGGDIQCRLEGDRVFLSGRAVTFLVGELHL